MIKKLQFIAIGLLATGLATEACSSSETAKTTADAGASGASGASGSSGTSGPSGTSGSSGSSGASGSSGTPATDAGSDASNDAGTDAAVPPAKEVNGCTSYVDRTAADADRDLIWDFSIDTDTERCMKVKVGQQVRFLEDENTPGNFGFHPLGAQGGDAPSPFPGALNAQTGAVTFANAGTFGYYCTAHPSMNGAIYVVP